MENQSQPKKGLQMEADTPSGNVLDALLLRRLYRYVKPYPVLLASATVLTISAAMISPRKEPTKDNKKGRKRE